MKIEYKITEYVRTYPESLVFVIDHEVFAHNKTGFYDHCLRFEDQMASFFTLIDH